MTAQELLDKRNTVIANMRTVLNTAKADGNRELTSAEQTECDGWETEAKTLMGEFNKKKKGDEREAWLAEQEKSLDRKAGERRTKETNLDDKAVFQEKTSKWNPMKEYDSSYRFAKYNERQMKYSPIRGSAEYSKAFERYLQTGDQAGLGTFDPSAYVPNRTSAEQNYLQSDDDVRGGYLVPSESFAEGLLKEVDDQTWIWKNSRVIVVKQSQSLGIRKLTAKMSSWGKGAELSNAFDNIDDSIRFGKKNLTPSYFTGAARISRDLLRMSTLDVEQLVYSEFGRDLGYVIEREDITGDGFGGPLGVLVASADGISTARDFSTNTTATTFAVETLIGAKYQLKPQYRNRARWMLHRDRIAELMKKRSDSGAGAGTGDFLWQPAIRAGEPDTVCGLPIDENEFFPTATGSGLYFGLLAVWEYYVHAIGLDMEILRLVETRAHLNQVEYVGRVKIDGMPVLEEAFTRLKYV